MLAIRNLKVSFGPNEVLKDISLDVKPGELLAVTGANGSGKTTLLNAVAGLVEPSSGTIHRDTPLALLPQELPLFKQSAIEFMLQAFPQVFDAYRKIKRSDAAFQDYAEAFAQFSDVDGYAIESELERLAADFGFDQKDLDRSLATFSEGQKQLFSVIRLLACPAPLLLMDEPLNHLDISMRVYLEEVVLREKRKGRGFLVVTHDRVFADRVADRTLFIQRGEGITVHGGYSEMIVHLELEFESRKRHAEEITRKISKLEKEVRDRKTWSALKEKEKRGAGDKGFISARAARMAKRAKAAEHRQERLIKRLEETKPFVEKKLSLSFASYDVVNRRVVSARGISKSFGERLIFEDVSLEVSTSQRIALIGPNGSGKTTLLRCLVGELEPDKGQVKLSDYVRYLYLPQDVPSAFKHEILLANLTGYGADETLVRQLLGGAKLRREKVLQPLATLSRGELMRAWIVGAIIRKAEFLFLDEPTNHLDIESLAVLDQLIDSFPGGMLVVSHDRYFISNHADQIISIQNNSLVPFNL